MTVEEWRPVPGWSEYSVSTSGRVRSEKRIVVCGDGRRQPVRECILRLQGPRVRLSRCGSKQSVNVHQLVVDVFGTGS